MNRFYQASITVVFACMTLASAAQDRADMDRTQIIGNRELPKVLYIVPWKKPTPGDLAGRPPVSVLDEALAPLDREVFRRQVAYDGQTRDRASASTTAPKPAPPTTAGATPISPTAPQKSTP